MLTLSCGRLALIGIEEPESALHPATAGVLFDALTRQASTFKVIATSQSADLLDREDLVPAVIRSVAMRDCPNPRTKHSGRVSCRE